MGNYASDAGKGVANGLLGLVGLGDVYDPIGDQRAKLADINAKTRAMMDIGTLQSLQVGTEISKQLFIDLKYRSRQMESFVKYNDGLIWQELARENLFITILFVVLLIVVFYNLFA